jgi:hypothetical protein
MSSKRLNANAPEFYPSNLKKIKYEYEIDIKKLEKYENKGCNESSHVCQDEIYRKFIKDIAFGKLNKLEDIKFISSLLVDKVIIHDKNRWYA